MIDTRKLHAYIHMYMCSLQRIIISTVFAIFALFILHKMTWFQWLFIHIIVLILGNN